MSDSVASDSTAVRLLQVLVITAAVFVLDQLCKYWLIEVVGMGARSPLDISDYFALVLAWNRGVSFSMFTTSAYWMPYVLVTMAVVISLLLLRLALKTSHRLDRTAYAMVIGGALGNALDRLRFGAVADFFYAHIGDLGWPAFNVADMGISIGVMLLLFSLVKTPARP